MKKILLSIGIIIVILCGCGREVDLESTLLSAGKIEEYDVLIADFLSKYKWNYDKTSLTYEIYDGIDAYDQRRTDIIEASKSVGLDIASYEKNSGVAATVTLLHFNGDAAGKAYFYIIDGKIVGAYYIYNSKIYSLTDRNVYILQNVLSSVEDTSKEAEYTEVEMNFPYSDYLDVDSDGHIAVMDEDNNMKICDPLYNCRLIADIKVSGGLYPMDICFTDSGAAVLAGKIDEAYSGAATEVEYEEESADHSNEKLKLKSWKVVFLNKNFKETGAELPLDISTYSKINVYDNRLFLTRDNTIDIFENKGGKYEKADQIRLDNEIVNMKFADIDKNGESEAVVTDGMDIFVYKYERMRMRLFWKSHLSVPSMTESLYIEDVNSDGVKEIYIEDLSETTARYIADEKCFKSFGKDIEFGNKYIPGDYNADGYTDYIRKNMQTGNAAIYLAKGA